MPDWIFFRDREGNRYYLDRTGKIRTTGEPEFKYRAVTSEGIDYYLNQGLELVKNRYQFEGLTILKSILSMPVNNNRIRNAQIKASGEINRMQKTGGSRFDLLNRMASISIFRENSETRVINDLMYYSVRSRLDVFILKNRLRENLDYTYSGVSLGFKGKASAGNKSNGFDFLMAVDSERYKEDIKSLDLAVSNWRIKLGEDTFKRDEYDKTGSYVIYRFSNRSKPAIAGYEGIYYNGIFSYILRIIIPEKNFSLYDKYMIELLKSFNIVKNK